jgi:hypothetical protein
VAPEDAARARQERDVGEVQQKVDADERVVHRPKQPEELVMGDPAAADHRES